MSTTPEQSAAPAPGGKLVQRKDVERHRRSLLTAAADAFAGNAEASLADVAQAAGLTRATLYRHFANKQSLLKAIQSEALERGSETLAGCRLDEGSSLDALRRVVTALSSHGMRFRIILMNAADGNSRFRAQRALVLAPVLDVIRRGQAEGEIRADLDAEWILTAMVTLLTAAVRSAAERQQDEREVAELVLRTLIHGISTMPDGWISKN